MMTPVEEAMRAVFSYLSEQDGFSCSWGVVYNPIREPIGGGISFEVRYLYSGSALAETFRVSWLDGELMLLRAGVKPVNRKVNLDLGAQLFELADPACFDQLVDAIKGTKRLPIGSDERKSVFDGGNWLFDG